ncbi:hypothetical protein Lal_00002085 [Lupinus albus]|nr:hypothetical protein Lal_00002085 [Lupinus albus]
MECEIMPPKLTPNIFLHVFKLTLLMVESGNSAQLGHPQSLNLHWKEDNKQKKATVTEASFSKLIPRYQINTSLHNTIKWSTCPLQLPVKAEEKCTASNTITSDTIHIPITLVAQGGSDALAVSNSLLDELLESESVMPHL